MSAKLFRPELQGLRALAVGLVLLFHLWPDYLSGGFIGVDVFFVVSGYLITGHLYKELTATGTISLAKFWARRVVRLLPLAFTVLVSSLVVMVLFLPQTVWSLNIKQITGSLFYVENWVLAADSVDYMAADNEPSLVQHYWSLSVEEQFYFLLPLILLGLFLLINKYGRTRVKAVFNERQIFIAALSMVTLLSLIFSASFTNYDAAQAYFVTPTRFWEFAAGGLLAMLRPIRSTPNRIQNGLGWAGILFIFIAAVLYNNYVPFPGYTALLPVIGTALFIWYGSHNPSTGVYWWASRRPAVLMGDWSYAIYLWHWPIIILATYQLEPLRWYHRVGILVLTFILSIASQKLIENPLRKSKSFKRPHRAFTMMATSMALIAVVTMSTPKLFAEEEAPEIALEECVGADALLSDCIDAGVQGPPLVSAVNVQQEVERMAFPACNIPAGKSDFDRSDCSLGVGKTIADLNIAVIGDSHARSWLPMLDEVGKQEKWHIQGYTKSGCTPVPFGYAPSNADRSDQEESNACRDFIVNTAQELENDPEIDVIITSAAPTSRVFYDVSGKISEAYVAAALNELWQDWENAGKEVLVVSELPHFGDMNGPTCIESNPDDIENECSLPTDELLNSKNRLLSHTAQTYDAPVDLYDPVPGICDENRCYSMVGQLITRYDHHHLSTDFAKSFGPDFADFIHQLAIT